MLDTTREVDGKTAAQRVEARGRSWEAAARHRQRIDITRCDRLALQTREFGIHKGQIKLGIMDHQKVGSDEFEKLVQNCGKRRLASEKLGCQAVDSESILR